MEIGKKALVAVRKSSVKPYGKWISFFFLNTYKFDVVVLMGAPSIFSFIFTISNLTSFFKNLPSVFNNLHRCPKQHLNTLKNIENPKHLREWPSVSRPYSYFINSISNTNLMNVSGGIKCSFLKNS